MCRPVCNLDVARLTLKIFKCHCFGGKPDETQIRALLLIVEHTELAHGVANVN